MPTNKNTLKGLLGKAERNMKPMPYNPKTQAPKFEGKPYNPKTDKKIMTPLAKKSATGGALGAVSAKELQRLTKSKPKNPSRNEGMSSNWFPEVGKTVKKPAKKK